MPLVTANQFRLQPNPNAFVGGIQQGQGIRGQFDQRQDKQQAQQVAQGEADRTKKLEAISFLDNAAAAIQGTPEGERAALVNSLSGRLQEFGIDPKALGQDFSDGALANFRSSLSPFLPQDLGGRDIGIKSSAPITDPTTGQISFPTLDPNTGQAALVPVAGAIGQTAEQKRQQEIDQKKALDEVDIATTKRKETIKRKVARTSEITQQMSERNRGAARQQRLLTQALTLAQQASQGLTGTAKLQLSRLIPGIDSSDEGALDSTLKQLSLEMLSSFKGPTTDFEFGVTEAIGGALGQSKEANIARLKSLERARFFNERESKQFQAFTKANGDPDNFRFDFSETVKTKKGPFTLEDIQATAVQNNLTIEETIERLNK